MLTMYEGLYKCCSQKYLENNYFVAVVCFLLCFSHTFTLPARVFPSGLKYWHIWCIWVNTDIKANTDKALVLIDSPY